MKLHHALLSLSIALSLPGAALAAAPAATKPPKETADQFVARINAEMKAMYPEITVPQWLAATYIGADTQMLSAKSNERWLALLNQWIEQAKTYQGQPMSAASARTLQLLKLSASMPPPKDPAALSELTQIATRLEGAYGAGSYCTGEGEAKTCRQLGELEDVLRESRDYAAQLDAWQGWHGVAAPMRKDYQRFVELSNQGAQNLGFANTGELWRSGYDMSPAELAAETDRLWAQVKPLYEELHCYTRSKLEKRYPGKGSVSGGLLPAHLLGNMWQQDWGNLWDMLEPYPGVGSLDITGALERQYQARLKSEQAKPAGRSAEDIERAARLATAIDMTRRAEDFYTSIGFPKLPESYWQNTQFIKPRDRDVVCHASAWDMNMQGDVRTKMCIKPNEEDFTTIYHELGHIYYDLAYNVQPALFQAGAHDGFHEAIGDVIVLAMTPNYLHSVGLVDKQQGSQQALINSQMRMALAKVAFLPFGLMIDRWRWGVFDGSIAPGQYNAAWWNLKAQYQGVAPISPRGEAYFDAGAKYHVPGNTPYTRYFLSHILQFQFYKALCDAAGHTGPLHQCSFYGSKQAGQRYWAMLSKGASQPWQQTMKELTGTERMDASAVLEYFAPLQTWLKEQNQGQQCGWQAPN